MNGFLLMVPFLLIRFGLLMILDRSAAKRAAYFAPMRKKENWIYWLYQCSNIGLMLYLFFLAIETDFFWIFYTGLTLYILGLILCVCSIVSFASSPLNGLRTKGIYCLSRNPMYVSYDCIFAGCAFLTHSLILGIMVFVFIMASHGIILAEERWCVEMYDEEYKQYMKRVRRYL